MESYIFGCIITYTVAEPWTVTIHVQLQAVSSCHFTSWNCMHNMYMVHVYRKLVKISLVSVNQLLKNSVVNQMYIYICINMNNIQTLTNSIFNTNSILNINLQYKFNLKHHLAFQFQYLSRFASFSYVLLHFLHLHSNFGRR